MPTASISGVAQPQPSLEAAAPNRGLLDYNAFLHLLMAEMKNQDPTKPVEASEFVAQLAAFSNVEQSIKLNAKLDALMISHALSQADGLIGQTITAEEGGIGGEVASVRIVTGGAVAVLTDGRELPLGAGVTIRAT